MTINKHIKIFYLLLTILFTEYSQSIDIDSKTFKAICEHNYGPKITMFTTILQKSTSEDFFLWMSSFENLYASPLVYAVYTGNTDIAPTTMM